LCNNCNDSTFFKNKKMERFGRKLINKKAL